MTNSLHMSRRRRGHGSRAPLLPQVVLMSSYLFALKTERYLVAGVTVCMHRVRVGGQAVRGRGVEGPRAQRGVCRW